MVVKFLLFPGWMIKFNFKSKGIYVFQLFIHLSSFFQLLVLLVSFSVFFCDCEFYIFVKVMTIFAEVFN